MLGLTTTRRLRAELADARAETGRMRRERDSARAERDAFWHVAALAARQFDEADAAKRRLEGRVLELGQRLTELADADPKYTASLEARVARLRRVGARILAAYVREQRRSARLSSHLDDDDLKAIKQWERRVKAHDAWTAPADLEGRPVDGGTWRPTHPAVELQRALDRCRKLQALLDQAKRVAS